MPNPTGNNQYGEKKYPSDSDLYDSFIQYSRENSGSGLSADEQLARLEKEHGLSISRRKLFDLRKKLQIPSVQKNTSLRHDRAQATIDLKTNDLAGKWGVEQARQRLANKGVLIARDELREHLHDHFDEEFDKRFIGSRGAIDCIPLNCLGPWHQVHCDGHEKLNDQALNMGTVKLPIYAFKDQFASFVLAMQVLPNVRNKETICHLFLDLVEMYGGRIPLQIVMDMGSKIGDMCRAQAVLRAEAAPDFTEAEWPSTVQVQSKKNTPIEGFWRWKRNGEGHSIREAILIGRNNGIYNPNNILHVNVFNWLWPPLVQHRLDEFCEYWNNHRVSSQKKKLLPSGTSPRQMWTSPESVRADAHDCSVYINLDTVSRLRDGIGGVEGRAKAFAFVDPEFQALADDALGQLEYPGIDLRTAWDVFVAVVDILSQPT
ncbi:hypothetical protein HGRIS_000843 [Hohenbuehelia grisea]|uniref:Integrase core domain-containing protein n=1 Tax=Hohenbuehelia grisea TaxID=104357 RepID=A0ABR3IPX8_9AGAR